MAWIIISITAVLFLLMTLAMLLVLRRTQARRAGGGAVPGAALPQVQGDQSARSYPARSPAMQTRLALVVCLALLLDIGIGGGVAAYFQRENIRQAELLQSEGVVTRATVVALEIEEDDEGDDDYYVTYTFVARPDRVDERKITRRDSVPYDLYRRMEEDGWIEVIYARSEPEVARITADYEPGSVDYIPAIIGAAVILPSLGALIWLFGRYRQSARLDEEGLTATAEVLAMYADSSSNSTSYYIVYQLPGDVPFRHAVSGSVYSQLQVGRHVTVRYLPDNPRVFRLEA